MASVGALGWACQDDVEPDSQADEGNDDGPGDVLRRDDLASIANNVLVPRTAAFAESTAALRLAIDAIVSDPSQSNVDAARAAWRSASVQWQELEVMQVGPAAPSLSGLGGEDARDEIYSWPTVDTCSVDRALVDEAYAAADFYTTQLVWAYGLDALEYLLFVDDEAHTCPAQVMLDGSWTAIGTTEVERRRAVYAQALASGLDDRASALAARWSPDEGDFAGALSDPGTSDSPYGDEVEALDEVFRAMFYVDRQTKDGKLGVPLGIVDGCPEAPCTNLMETPWSGGAAANIAANLRGLREVVLGGPDAETADGFDDLLEAVGERAIADQLLAQIDAAVQVAESIGDPLQQVAVADVDQAQSLYDAVKEVTDTLKGPFVMALMLTIPAEGAGDND